LSGPDDGLSPLAKSYRAAAPWLNAVWQFTGSALFGVAVGYGLDRWWGTQPWALIIGGLVGSGVGFYAFIRSATRLLDEQSKQRKQEQQKPPDGNEPK
jgi:ATP synthase protein I